jgi:signal transduction histidine kinase
MIGRSHEADVILTHPEVSRCHARVWRNINGEFMVEDLGSTNGTFVRGLPVRKRILTFGDQIQLGSSAVLALTHQWPSAAQHNEQCKLEGIGRLAAGVANEFNGVFAVIRSMVDHVLQQSSLATMSHSELRDCLGDVDVAVRRAVDLTRQLMGFSQHVKLQPEEVKLGRVVADVLRLTGQDAEKRIAIKTKLDTELTVLGDRPQLQQVLMNLVFNAIDAMPDGGTLSLGLARLPEHTESAEIRGPVATVTVADTGEGMDRETLERAFEPFFTTKPAGMGSGLGLAFAHGVVRGHGGTITIQSEVGVGTTVRIFLPLMELTREQARADTRRAVPVVFVKDRDEGDDEGC